MSRPNNPCAFARGTADGKYVQRGMALRDYFAAAALTGYLTAEIVMSEEEEKLTFGQRVASRVYKLADAMLAERQKEK